MFRYFTTVKGAEMNDDIFFLCPTRVRTITVLDLLRSETIRILKTEFRREYTTSVKAQSFIERSFRLFFY